MIATSADADARSVSVAVKRNTYVAPGTMTPLRNTMLLADVTDPSRADENAAGCPDTLHVICRGLGLVDTASPYKITRSATLILDDPTFVEARTWGGLPGFSVIVTLVLQPTAQPNRCTQCHTHNSAKGAESLYPRPARLSCHTDATQVTTQHWGAASHHPPRVPKHVGQ